MTNSRPGHTIGVLLITLSTALLVVSLSGCSKPVAPVAGPSPATPSVGAPLTDEECLATAREIEAAVVSGDSSALDKLIDWDAVNDRFTSGIDAPAQFRKDFLQGLKESWLQNKGLTNGIIDAAKNGGSYTLLHSHSQEKRRWLLFRLLLPESGLNYHDLLLARRPDGKIKVVDLYFYLSGELLSQSLRRSYIQLVAENSGGVLERLSGADKQLAKNIKNMAAMVEAGRSGKFREVIDIYNKLPDDIKKNKGILIQRIQAFQNLGDDAEYTRSIADFRKFYPDDRCIDMISIDFYQIKKNYAEALACVDRLDSAVHGDPYLQIYRANLHMEQNEPVAARADLTRGIEAEPEILGFYTSLIELSLREKKFDETLQILRLIRTKFQLELGDLRTVPSYKDFVESPQYQEWLKDNPVPAEKPETGKDSGDKPNND